MGRGSLRVIRQFVQDIEIISLPADAGLGIDASAVRFFRTAWDEEKEEWFFSIVDVIAVLTDQPNQRGASNYWAKLKQRLKEEGADQLLTNCQQLKLKSSKDGKRYLGLTAASSIDQAVIRQFVQDIEIISLPAEAPPLCYNYSNGLPLEDKQMDKDTVKDLTLMLMYLTSSVSYHFVPSIPASSPPYRSRVIPYCFSNSRAFATPSSVNEADLLRPPALTRPHCGPADVDSEDAESPLWSAHVEYSNGEIQDMESADDVPDPVLELLSALAELFE